MSRNKMRLAPDGSEQKEITAVFGMEELEHPARSSEQSTQYPTQAANDEPVSDYDRVAAIVEQHKDKEFVRRILTPHTSPHITSEQDDRLKQGDVASHQMSWGQNAPGDQATEFYVYPEVVNDKGKLHWFKENEPYGEYENAAQYAEKTGERITFDKKEDAEWFSTNYKRLWND